MIEVLNNMDYNQVIALFKERAEKAFSDYPQKIQFQAWKVMYEQYKLDERTELIQGFKRNNIKEIHNGR